MPLLVMALSATACTAALAQAGIASGDGSTAQLSAQQDAAGSAAVAAADDAEAKAIFEANCSSCHEISDATSQRKDLAGWTETVAKMVSYGAPVAAQDQERIVAYLAAAYPSVQP